MRSVVCHAPGEVRLVEQPMPMPREGEVLVRVRRVAVGGLDMNIVRGSLPALRYPRVPGHELSGEVVSAPPGCGLLPRNEVYVVPYLSCGTCVACRKGSAQSCSRVEVLGVHRDGAMAEYIAVPSQFVFKTEGITLDEAAMLGSLAVGAYAVRRAGVHEGQRVLVLGAGPVAIATALFARLKGAAVTVLDESAARLAFCRDMLGLVRVVQVGENDVPELWRHTGGEFFGTVFGATDELALIERGLDFVAHGGTFAQVSAVAGRISFSDAAFHKREITLMGSRHAAPEDFRTVMDAIRAGQVPIRAINTHRATLSSLATVLPRWMDPASGVIKAIVEV
jgi:2-desacetyl-2-hydroxyethyl bacteriochlorophyllide A dehydrogenase